jgi:hypothetical protein
MEIENREPVIGDCIFKVKTTKQTNKNIQEIQEKWLNKGENKNLLLAFAFYSVI